MWLLRAAATTPLSFTQDTIGPMGRRAVEVARLTDVLSGLDPHDAASLTGPGGSVASRMARPLAGLRVGVVTSASTPTPEVGDVYTAMLAWLTGEGVELVEVEVDGWQQAPEEWAAIAPVEGAAELERELAAGAPMAPDVLHRLRQGQAVTGSRHAEAQAWRRNHQRTLARLFEDVDLLTCPTTPVSAPPIAGHDVLEWTARLGADALPWALFDGPTLTVPAGLAVDGLPVGASFTAPPWREDLLFQVAAANEDRA